MNTFANSVTSAGIQRRISTENGAATLNTTGNALVDLFFVIGASRGKNIDGPFARAFSENAEIATRILLWSRDVRGGAGERQTFRNLFRSLSSDVQYKVLNKIPELGRYDDLLAVTDPNTPQRLAAFSIIKKALDDAKAGNSNLCAKWMPRKGAVAAELRSYLKMTPKAFRKMLVSLTNVVETPMCAREFGVINYEHVPSVAMSRYMKAFGRRDGERFTQYIQALQKGEAKVNASAVYPYDVLRALRSGNKDMANQQWKSLPDFVGEGRSFLPMCDVSGSMQTSVSGSVTALDVSVSLGLYLSERNKSAFKDVIMTFSGQPQLQKLTGDLNNRYEALCRTDWAMNTNLEAAFAAILAHAKQHYVSQEDMPGTLIILSDMEFDACVFGSSSNGGSMRGYGYRGAGVNDTLYENARKQYEAAGYKLPNVVFWNLNARNTNNPVSVRDSGTALVSGFSPAIISNVLGDNMSPLQIVLDTVMVDRYAF
jgi:hypothetical protein